MLGQVAVFGLQRFVVFGLQSFVVFGLQRCIGHLEFVFLGGCAAQAFYEKNTSVKSYKFKRGASGYKLLPHLFKWDTTVRSFCKNPESLPVVHLKSRS